MADSSTTSGASKLDHQIKGQLEHLQTLLQKKRDSEEAHNVFWPNCEASGEGYVGCNPLNEGECPPEQEFKTTFRNMPWANSYAKNAETNDMMRCVPAYLVGKSVSKQKRDERRSQSLQERILRAIHTIEKNWQPLQDASAFQWNVPCDEARSREQCEIMRDAPKYDAHGRLQYAEHGSRCMWRPAEDKDWEQGDPTCVARADQDYKMEPITANDLEEIRTRITKMTGIDNEIKQDFESSEDLKRISTVYDTPRMMLTKKDKALTQAMVRLPLLPHLRVVQGLNKWVQGFTGDKDVKVYEENPILTLHSYIGDPTSTQAEEIIKTKAEYDETKGFGKLLRDLKDKAKGIEELCDVSNPDYTWQSMNNDLWMRQFLVPSDATESLTKRINQYAKTTWWKFAAEAMRNQSLFVDAIQSLIRRLASTLRNKKKREKLERSLTSITKVNDTNKVTIDASFLKPLIRDDVMILNAEMLGDPTKVSEALRKMTNTGNYKLTVGYGNGKVAGGGSPTVVIEAGGGTVRSRLDKDALFMFNDQDSTFKDDPKPGDEDAKEHEKHWNTIAAKIVEKMVAGNFIPPLDKDGDGYRALARRGLSDDLKFRAFIEQLAYVAHVDAKPDDELEHQQSLLASIQRIERMNVMERVKAAMRSENMSNQKNRITMSFYSVLNSEHDPAERYRIAISQIPKLLNYDFDEPQVTRMIAQEIRKYFSGRPGEPLYYNRKVTMGNEDDDVKDWATEAAGKGSQATLQTQAAARLVKEAKDKIDEWKRKQEEEDDTDNLVSKLRELLQKYRAELRSELSAGRLPVSIERNHGQTFEERFGRGSYVHPFSGATRKELTKRAAFLDKSQR